MEHISNSTIVGIIFTACISIGLPVAAFIIYRIKTKAAVKSALIGAITFIVFALVLEQLLHKLVLGAFGASLTSNIWLYALYGGLAAGLFEETGRLLAMKLFMKKNLTKENGVMYGIGHGGVESILIVGLAYISNLVTALMINSGSFELTLNQLDAETKALVMQQISALWTMPSSSFFLAGVERIFAFMLQLSLSYIVYRAVKDRKIILYFLAVAIHFAVDACIVVLAKFTSVYVVEAVLVVLTMAIAIPAYVKYKAEPSAAPPIAQEEKQG